MAQSNLPRGQRGTGSVYMLSVVKRRPIPTRPPTPPTPAPPAGDEMLIFVKTPNDTTHNIYITPRDTIRVLRHKVYQMTGIEPEFQRLIYGGTDLRADDDGEDMRTIADYFVEPGETVHLVLRLKGGGGNVTIILQPGDTHKFHIQINAKVSELRAEIRRAKVGDGQYRLVFNGQYLRDEKTMADYFEHGDTVHITLREEVKKGGN